MTPFVNDPDFVLHVGDALDVLATLPDESVHCVVTSPPYWGLRDYGTEGQLGLEPTPEEYVSSMVAVFREVRRVLRRDGTCWLNLGDSFSHGGNGSRDPEKWPKQSRNDHRVAHAKAAGGTRPKDMVGIPWRLAFALQQPYYTGRIERERDRVWLAAMIDAEGTICGFRHERPDGNIRTGCLTFITNGSEAILDECDRIWPGSRYTETLKAGDKVLGGVATRPCWRWELQSAEDRSALVRELYPYLIEKKRQALVAWNLLELVQAAKRMGRGGETSAIKDKRDYLVRTLSDLNQKRDVDLPSWLEPVPSLHEEGWYVRSDIVWSKKNPMPESVTDRPTKAHEYLFLLTKSARYFYDADAIREPAEWARWGDQTNGKHEGQGSAAGWIGSKSKDDLQGKYANPGNRTTNGPRSTERRHETAGYAQRLVSADGGKNKRSVWEIATEPYPDAHFATFPQALVEPCVLAGTSERGCCPECGAPWERETERTPMEIDRSDVSPYDHHSTRASGRMLKPPTSETTGWNDTCECGRGDRIVRPVPCTVLDPFMGSGTVAVVARRLGRRAVGIELNPEYALLAAKRLAQLSLLAA